MAWRRLAGLFCLVYAPLVLNGFYNIHLAKLPGLFWLVEAITWVLLPVWAFRAVLVSETRESIGLTTIAPTLSFLMTCLFAVVFLSLAHYLAFKTAKQFVPQNMYDVGFSYAQMLPRKHGSWLLAANFFALSAAIVEEILYRGLLFRIFDASKKNILLFVLLSAGLTAAAHWEGGIWDLAATFVYGLLAAAVYVKIRSLWPLMLAHFSIDLIAVAAHSAAGR